MNTGYDTMNRANQVSGGLGANQTTYVNSVGYAAHGGVGSFVFGNSVARLFGYNPQLQLNSIADTVNNSPSGYLLVMYPNWGTSNSDNGTLQSAQTYAGGPGAPSSLLFFNDVYYYDGVNRLKAAYDYDASNNLLWGRAWGYDAYGNMWMGGASGVPVNGMTPTANVYNSGNNRISGGSYDAAGNQTVVGSYSLAYDAENHQTIAVDNATQGQATYVYDGDGRRAQKVIQNGPTTTYVYDIGGKLVAEYSSAAPPTSPCYTCYLSHDHLGSTRLVTDQNAAVIARHDYLPFGEEIPGGSAGRSPQWGPATDNIDQKFTGKERDFETGLDYFGSRYYGSALARWTSPDLVNLTDDRILSPSNTINKYIYGGNSPLKFTDPDGEDITLFYTNGGPAGHAMLLAYNQETGDAAAQSFGPASHSNATELQMFLGIPVQGTANYGFEDINSADQLRQEYSSITIQTSPEETQKAIQYIRTHSDGKYDTYTNNCSTTCARILRDLKLLKGGPVIIPRDLFTTTAADYSKRKFINPWDYPQHGKDYGNSRPGYDPFELLFLTMQQQETAAKKPKEEVRSKVCFNEDNGERQVCPSSN